MTTTKKRQPPYSGEENTATLALYFDMLAAVTAGRPYNKAAMIRTAQGRHCDVGTVTPLGPLARRSKQSIEFKLMNATACHLALVPGATITMDSHGYRAMANYQADLKDAMRQALADRWLITAEGVA